MSLTRNKMPCNNVNYDIVVKRMSLLDGTKEEYKEWCGMNHFFMSRNVFRKEINLVPERLKVAQHSHFK